MWTYSWFSLSYSRNTILKVYNPLPLQQETWKKLKYYFKMFSSLKKYPKKRTVWHTVNHPRFPLSSVSPWAICHSSHCSPKFPSPPKFQPAPFLLSLCHPFPFHSSPPVYAIKQLLIEPGTRLAARDATFKQDSYCPQGTIRLVHSPNTKWCGKRYRWVCHAGGVGGTHLTVCFLV